MSGYDIFAWIVLVILVICVVGVFCIAGWLSGHIAKSPKHLYADAVTVAGWITLIFGFALWLRSISLGMALAFNDVRHALTRLAATGRISGEHSFSGRIAMKAAFALFILVFALASPARAQTARWDDLANLPFPNSYPTKEAADKLRDELVFERAVQVYLWALPAVNLMAMREGSEKAFGAGYNVFPVWKERLNAKTIVTTPNSDVIYAMAYVDVGTDGPLVIEIPPEQQGILDDFWQRPVSGPTVDGKTYAGDVGLPGPDKGRGGKFLLLPPGYQGNVPDGYYSYRSRTNNVLVFWRAFFNDPNNLGPAVRLIEQTRIYPLGKAAQAKPMQFPDASGVAVNMDYPRDGAFYDMLARFIDSETTDPMDLGWRGMLAAIGIVKGQPFNPDAHTRAILDTAAKTGFKMSRAMIYADLEDKPGALIYKDRHWLDPTCSGATNIEYLDKSESFRSLDLRTGVFSMIYAASPAMLTPTPGEGARYLTAFKDANGDFLSGDNTYVLHLPPNVPAAFFWSATLYDPLTASGLDNGQPFPSINSHDKPSPNAEGSYDIYFGPTAPAGKERNWRRTVPGKSFFTILRLYGPTQAYFDQTWKPGDIEGMN